MFAIQTQSWLSAGFTFMELQDNIETDSEGWLGSSHNGRMGQIRSFLSFTWPCMVTISLTQLLISKYYFPPRCFVLNGHTDRIIRYIR